MISQKSLISMLFIISILFTYSTIITMASEISKNVFIGSKFGPEQTSFVTTGNLNFSRKGLTSTILNDGRVLAAGGSFFSVAELYNPSTGIWNETDSMDVTREEHTATLLNNGKVLVAGGNGEIATAELFDPSSDTWSPTGDMHEPRMLTHSATLLQNGKVLVAGGRNISSGALSSAEIFEPSTGLWSVTGSMNIVRYTHSATLLDNGKVLVVGGNDESQTTELYDPSTGIWSYTANLNHKRRIHTATLLDDGRVLVSGGSDGSSVLNSAELYDPSTETWSLTGNMNFSRIRHTATLLNNGMVLVAGSSSTISGATRSAELYNPTTGLWHSISDMNVNRYYHAAVLLKGIKVLIIGGHDGSNNIGSSEIGIIKPSNTFTGTMTLPSGWLTSNSVAVQLLGTTSDASVNAGALSNDNLTWGDWITISPDVTANTNWNVGEDGIDKPIYLRFKDIYDQTATVISGTVNADTTVPIASVSLLNIFHSTTTFPVSWSGTDATSGIETYDIQYRDGEGAWTDWITTTSNLTDNFTGEDNHTYYFRARAHDQAGNTSSYSEGDAQTTVDISLPVATSLSINGGALNTTSTNVKLAFSGSDQTSGVAQMAFSNGGSTWGGWLTYSTTGDWALLPGDGEKTVYLRLKDAVGNISELISSTINLDTGVGNEFGISINSGALFTNHIDVNLSIGAPPFIAEMKVTNDGGFSGAVWEPYSSHKDWTIIQLGSHLIPRLVYVKYKDFQGNISGTYFDNIILDVTPPTGSISIEESSGEETNAYGMVTLLLAASDDVSGVESMQISLSEDFSNAEWESFVTSRQFDLQGNFMVYARFRDYAGNVSITYHTPYLNFLPLLVR